MFGTIFICFRAMFPRALKVEIGEKKKKKKKVAGEVIMDLVRQLFLTCYSPLTCGGGDDLFLAYKDYYGKIRQIIFRLHFFLLPLLFLKGTSVCMHQYHSSGLGSVRMLCELTCVTSNKVCTLLTHSFVHQINPNHSFIRSLNQSTHERNK